MGRSKESWLREGAGDLREAVVDDVPTEGESVKVRGLAAAYSSQASSEALEMRQVGRDQIARVDQGRMEVLQFSHGCVDPTFTVEEAGRIAENFGPAFRKVVDKIDELSGVDKEAIAEANARFQGGGADANGPVVGDGSPAGDSRPNLSPRVGAEVGPDRQGDDDG